MLRRRKCARAEIGILGLIHSLEKRLFSAKENCMVHELLRIYDAFEDRRSID